MKLTEKLIAENSEILNWLIQGYALWKKEVLLNAVRNIPDRRWNNEQKIWLIPNSEAAKQALLENLYETGEFSDKAAGSGGSAFLLPQRAA